jgi:hypothetical protein
VAERAQELTEQELSNWKLVEVFEEALRRALAGATLHPTFDHPARSLTYCQYLSLQLFGWFNPVVKSMRALCAITVLPKVRQTVGCAQVSMGSFSELQHMVEPDLLKQVFGDLLEQMPAGPNRDPQLEHLELIAQDGSLWSALPRMAWAEYGVGSKGTAKGVRMHLRFNILKDRPSDVLIGVGKSSETQALRDMLVVGQTTVADRLYGQDYQLMAEIDRAKAFFVFRISDRAVIDEVESLPITPEDAAAGVVRHAWVHLGATEKLRTIRLRLVEVKKDGQHLFIVTNHPVETVSAQLVALIYRRRWSIELFFRWIKCTLGCRHFLAESPRGVAIQLYLALIASVILYLFTGQRPNRRTLEMLQFYLMGWASIEDVMAAVQRATKAKSKTVR